MSRPTIMIMAGGTGGHVFPALALADAMKGRGWDVVWLGTEAGIDVLLYWNGKRWWVAQRDETP